jgi:UDP-3-O-[3-hydroxymyristoyl] glucosamine N-acyltransferase
MTLQEIAAIAGVTFPQDTPALKTPITRGASLELAGPGDIVFFEHPKYLRALRNTKAEVALVPENFEENLPLVLLRVPSPSKVFTAILQKLAPAPMAYAPGIHPSAVVAPDAQIDPTASIQPLVVIESGVKIGAHSVIGAQSFVGRETVIGESCFLHPNVVLREHSVLGARVIIHSGTVIGSDGFGYHQVEGRHEKVPQIGHVQIDDDVEIGACTTIDRARFGRTWIQHGTKIDNLVQIAHNVVIGPHCLIISQTGISGSAKLGQYVTLAGQVGVVGHVEVGDRVVVAAKSGVSKDTPAGETLLGMIGAPMKEAREVMVQTRRLPMTVERIKTLENEVKALRALIESQSKGANGID